MTSVVDLFIPKINPEEFLSGVSNINSMIDSYTIYFNENPSIMNHNNTKELDGKLMLSGTNTTGYSISNTLNTDFDVNFCELRRYTNFETSLDTYHVSNNGGSTWEVYDIDSGEPHEFAAPGDQLALKITLNRDSGTAVSPSYESVCLLYK
jgi:hypothetical protein